MDVGIRELKARLSEYVNRAAGGEVVRITDRGVPRAVLMPVPGPDAVERGLAEGWIVRRVDEPPGDVVPVVPRSGRTTTQILADDRDE